jgi:hypothetical protein
MNEHICRSIGSFLPIRDWFTYVIEIDGDH